MIFHYLLYRLKCKTLHGIHSPFVYSLVKDVIYNKNYYASGYEFIEKQRQKLIQDTRVVESYTFGAESKYKSSIKTVGQVCKASAKSKKYAKLLSRLAKWKHPQHALELGTSLGISALYQAVGFGPETVFTTIEGNNAIAAKAQEAFDQHGLNIKLLTGNFDIVLPEFLKNKTLLDWVFFDGNHKKEPTLRYFNLCLNHASQHALFIFDDINWSDEMREAWKAIKNHPKVSLTIDLFFMGLVFFDQRPQKEHFIVGF